MTIIDKTFREFCYWGTPKRKIGYKERIKEEKNYIWGLLYAICKERTERGLNGIDCILWLKVGYGDDRNFFIKTFYNFLSAYNYEI